MHEGVDPVLTDRIRPFAPVLYLAWADGGLTARELDAIARTPTLGGLDAATRAELRAWLNPGSPPSTEALQMLLDAGRDAAARLGTPASLVQLGLALASVDSDDTGRHAILEATLAAMQSALGVVPGEAARSFRATPREPGEAATTQRFDPQALNALIDRDHFALRRRVFDVMARPDFTRLDENDHPAYREQVLDRCRTLVDEGFSALAYPSEFGGRNDVSAAIAVFETLAFGDSSLLVKFGVQFGLFAGSIYQLGTRVHHEKWLRPALTLELPGCFAMSETAHGSNVRDIETTATWQRTTGTFVVHTPSANARKDYIGNAALHGRMATVFAQLEVDGQNRGVHALLVPLRDARGRLMPGVQIEDCGPKAGLNGVDNGRIAFDRVPVPRENLLDRFGRVGDDGMYTSPIASPARRFFTMLGTLVSGRVSIAAASLSAAKVGLTFAVRHTDRRRQFGPEGEPEVPLLEYRTMQRRLLPRLATAFALDFAIKDLIRRFAQHEEAAEEIESMAAGFKAYASDFAVRTLRVCREACGGLGYLSASGLPRRIADTDVFTTFEGANTVLRLLVARALLTEYREEFGELRLWSVVRWVGGRATSAVTELNPIITRRTDEAHLRDPDFHMAALRWREARMLDGLARRLRRRIEQGEDSFTALNACQDHAERLASVHVERLVLERFVEGIAAIDDDSLVRPLSTLASLFALRAIERDAGWFLEKGYIEGGKAGAVREQVNRLCGEVRVDAVALVEALGI